MRVNIFSLGVGVGSWFCMNLPKMPPKWHSSLLLYTSLVCARVWPEGMHSMGDQGLKIFRGIKAACSWGTICCYKNCHYPVSQLAL